MKRMMNAAATCLGGALIVALAACSANDPAATEASPPATPGVGATPKAHAPKLSVVRAPASQAMAAVRRLSAAPRPGGASHVLSGGPAGTCGYTSGDATCDACITGTCCTEDAACAADADCSALVTCYDACADDTCFSSCDGAHAAGAAKLDTLMSCVETSCATDCGGPPPPPPGPGPGPGACGGVTSGDPTCDACLDTTCCADVTACISDADCRDFMSCLDACSDAACQATCQTAHPAGATELTALSTCVTSSCSACTAASPPPPSTPPPPSSGPASCGLSSGVASCDACIDTSCCAQSTACVGDGDCTALIGCLDACTDDACANACAAAHAAGATELDAVVSCVETSCAPSCN